MSAIASGYALRTSERPASFRLAGPRSAHPDVRFPLCPGCGYPRSPIFRIDFADPRLATMGLWSGDMVTLVCHNECWPADGRTDWYDYQRPLEPTLLDADQIRRASVPLDPLRPDRGSRRLPVEDFEFDEVAVDLVPRDPPRVGFIDLESCVGGEPSWLQGKEPHDCRFCGAEMAFLIQWSEANMTHLPARLHAPRPQILGSPFVRFWFGCRACRVVASFSQMD